MKVTAPAGVYLPALGRPVAEGETVDVPDEHGASLVEQGWHVPTDSKSELSARQIAEAIDEHNAAEPDTEEN